MHACDRAHVRTGSIHPRTATDDRDATAEATEGHPPAPSSLIQRACTARRRTILHPSSNGSASPSYPSILPQPSIRAFPAHRVSAHHNASARLPVPSFLCSSCCPPRSESQSRCRQARTFGWGGRGCGMWPRSRSQSKPNRGLCLKHTRWRRRSSDRARTRTCPRTSRCVGGSFSAPFHARVCATFPRTFQRLSGRFWTAGAQVRRRASIGRRRLLRPSPPSSLPFAPLFSSLSPVSLQASLQKALSPSSLSLVQGLHPRVPRLPSPRSSPSCPFLSLRVLPLSSSFRCSSLCAFLYAAPLFLCLSLSLSTRPLSLCKASCTRLVFC